MRTESLVTWAIGAALGAVVGFIVLVGGSTLLGVAVVFVALAFVAARSLALLSGMFVGVGGAWFALALRAQVVEGFGTVEFLWLSVVVLAAGLVVGAVAWRRRTRQAERGE